MSKALLITLEYPPDHGGVARYLGNIYSRLSSENLIVLAPKNPKALEPDFHQKYKIYRRKFNAWWIWPKWKIISWHVLKILWLEKITEIHISHILPIGYVAYIYRKIFNIPYIVYAHGMDILLPQTSVWKNFWLKKILKNARQIISNSYFTKNEIVKLGLPENKIKVIYPCVKEGPPLTEEVLENLKIKYNLDGKKIILSVGRLVARKGFDQAIEVMSKILGIVPNTVYVIIGSGPYLIELQAKSHGLPVIFINNIGDNELDCWYKLCDVFAMPARQIGPDVEGFGIVFLEAALRGKSSVGGRSGGVPEAIEDGKTGILADPLNIDEIATALIKLLRDDKLRSGMGEAAKQRVLEKFICK